MVQFSSVTQSCLTLCDPMDSSTPGLPTPGVYSNICPLSQWCHRNISVVPFSSCPQSFPVSGSFPRSQFFALGGQSIGASASAPVLPMNIQGQFPLRIDWFDLLAVQGILAIKYEIYFSSIYFPLLLPLECKFHRWGVLPALFIFISWHEKILITCVRHSSTFAEWIRE